MAKARDMPSHPEPVLAEWPCDDCLWGRAPVIDDHGMGLEEPGCRGCVDLERWEEAHGESP